MSYTFTIDEDIIRRLALREKRESQVRKTHRRPLLQFWQGSPSARDHEAKPGTGRPRWS
jgi:hypothetical protein